MSSGDVTEKTLCLPLPSSAYQSSITGACNEKGVSDGTEKLIAFSPFDPTGAVICQSVVGLSEGGFSSPITTNLSKAALTLT